MFTFVCLFLILLILFKRLLLERFRVKNLHEKPVFITGCDSGFGQLLVLKLLKHQIPTFAGCLTNQGEQELKRRAGNLPGKLVTLKLDVKNDESVRRAYDSIEKELNGKALWGVVCNAGVLIANGPDDWMNVDHYATTIDVNTLGVIRVCHQFKPMLKRSKGRLVIMSSIFGRTAFPYTGPYVVSKFAVEGYADIVRLEARYFGFTVHVLEPGFFTTSISSVESVFKNGDRLWADLPANLQQEYGQRFCEKIKKMWKANLCKYASANLHKVVNAYFDALTSRFPRDRYSVGLDAKYFFIPLSYTPSWWQAKWLWLIEDLDGAPVPDCVRRKLQEKKE